MPEITLEHIRDMIQGARAESRAYDEGIRTEISGVNHRLDKVNGRLDKHGDRITMIETDQHLHQRTQDTVPRVHSRSDDGKWISRRDAVMFCAGGGALWGVIKGAIWLLAQLKAVA